MSSVKWSHPRLYQHNALFIIKCFRGRVKYDRNIYYSILLLVSVKVFKALIISSEQHKIVFCLFWFENTVLNFIIIICLHYQLQ